MLPSCDDDDDIPDEHGDGEGASVAAHGRHLHVDVHGVTDAGGARVEAVHVHVSLVERVEPRARRLLLLSAGDSGSTKRSSDVTYVMNESVRQRRHMLYSALPTHSTDAADADVTSRAEMY